MPVLVFDVGMHNGDDTAHYLSRGYDVVAVEANAALCDAAERRFARELADGRLQIRNVGIAETAGELEFWVSDQTEWSSFDRENATQEGTHAVARTVRTIPFSDLLAEHSTPFYVKVDIERHDTLCIRQLAQSDARPEYLSFEGHLDAVADIDVLAAAGYSSFKCIRQIDWAEITPENMERQATIRRLIARTGRVPRLSGYLHRLHYRPRTVDGRTFAPGSSGPLGRDLPGRWLTRDEVVAVWNHRLDVDRRMGAHGLGEWFDIHAAVDASAQDDLGAVAE